MKTRAWLSLAVLFAIMGFLSFACGGSPAAPSGTATIQGTVNAAADSASATSVVSASSPGGISVSVAGTQLSSVTDPAGRFSLSGVPAGTATLQFQGPSIKAQLQLSGLAAGQTMTIHVQVSGSQATLQPAAEATPTPSPSPSPSPTTSPEPSPSPTEQKCFDVGAHAEVEGTIQAKDAGSITVFQQGAVKGNYVCEVSTTTTIRKGNKTFTFDDLQLGWRVHVKGTGLGLVGTDCQVDASEVKVQ
jgi:hypothetical protein